MEKLCAGDAEAAAEGMRRHIASSKDRAVERLQPYFQMSATRGTTHARSARKQVAAPLILVSSLPAPATRKKMEQTIVADTYPGCRFQY